MFRAGLTPAQIRELRAAGLSTVEALRAGLERGGLALRTSTLTAARQALAALAAGG
jgi:hypothetical protein